MVAEPRIAIREGDLELGTTKMSGDGGTKDGGAELARLRNLAEEEGTKDRAGEPALRCA
jgi:hypothetical protein